MWAREEALAAITAVEMVDLPVSENQAKYEDEFGSQKGAYKYQLLTTDRV